MRWIVLGAFVLIGAMVALCAPDASGLALWGVGVRGAGTDGRGAQRTIDGPRLRGHAAPADPAQDLHTGNPDVGSHAAQAGDMGCGYELVLVAAVTDRDTYELGEPIRVRRVFENPTDCTIAVTTEGWRRPMHGEVGLMGSGAWRLYKPPTQDAQESLVEPNGRVENEIAVEVPSVGTWTVVIPRRNRAASDGRPNFELTVTVIDRGDPRHIAAKADRLARAIALEDPDCPTCWSEAQKDLQSLGAAAVPHLRRWLREDASPHLRAVAAKLLGPWASHGTHGRDELLAGLQDADPHVRRMCVRALPASSETLWSLLPLLKDPDTWVRVDAIEVISASTDFLVLPALVRSLEDEEDYVRQRAAMALAKKGNAAGIEVLLTALEASPAFDAFSIVNSLEALSGVSFGEAEMPFVHSSGEDVERAIAVNTALAKRWLKWWADEGRIRYGD